MGMLTPCSHIAHMVFHYGDDITYLYTYYITYYERVHNLIISLYDVVFRDWIALPRQNEIAQRYFGHLSRKLN